MCLIKFLCELNFRNNDVSSDVIQFVHRLYPCNPCTSYQTDLRKQIYNKKKRKKDSGTGPFMFPDQSRVTGAKYSYQWMALAQQNSWHVLLAGALGPKDMDCLYSVQTSLSPHFTSDSIDGLPGLTGVEGDGGEVAFETRAGANLPAFSGAYTSALSPLESDYNGQRSKQKGSSPYPPFWFSDHHHVHEIEEEHESSNPAHMLNSSNLYEGSSTYRQGISGNGITSGNGPEAKESVIRRETEGEFRLLGIEEGRKQIFW
ncbi:hypothetical protein POM88_031493 [Heracleum sosnowskyi]|uniref:Uncharacterized protein n=1 Tax=Heracleum sosnowskyi TaxID=360622 RepID=A0AAD8MGP5_9APIA|nr:hypothetical protein POM88_031493 [Heracleum sosnowskyi]